jgi:hypothetical protein
VKVCPACREIVHAAALTCPACGHEFPEREARHDDTASGAPILAGEEQAWEETVRETTYHVHRKKGDPLAPPTMRVDYRVAFNRWVREWICIEHPAGSYPHRKARQWWQERSREPMPRTVEEAVFVAQGGGLCRTEAVRIEKGPPGNEGWERVIGHTLGDLPPRIESTDDLEDAPGVLMGVPEDDLPF